MGDALRLKLLYVSRCGTCVAAMVYAGALPFLREAWGMDAATAGSVQSAYNFANALTLLVASWLADRVGAKRVFLVSAWAGVAASALFALFARSHETAVALFALVAVTQGGTYTPALMLVAEMVPAARRGGAIGALLAAGSFGYLLSVLASMSGAALLDYRWGFALCALGPLLGAGAGSWALRGRANRVPTGRSDAKGHEGLMRSLVAPVSVLLTLGYTAHCWELLGAWAWVPAFLAGALQGTGLGPLATGIAVAASVHLAGMAATLAMGMASDRWGRRAVLIGAAIGGASLSSLLGWSAEWGWGPAATVGLAFVASFAILGDSGVLSTAMTEAVPARHLGTALAVRSIFGFGAGALSPVAFGLVLDATGRWGFAFLVLGAGGAVATLAALRLPRAKR